MKVSRYAIGDDRFVEEVESDLRDVRENKGVYGDIVWPEGKHLSFAIVAKAAADQFGLKPEDLLGRSHVARTAKKIAAELCCRYCGQSQCAVGEYFGYRGNGSITKQRQRLREILSDDSGVRRKLKRLEKALAAS